MTKDYIVELNGFPDYFVSTSGNVYSDKFNKFKIMKPYPTGTKTNKYYSVTLMRDGYKIRKKVHKLVSDTFMSNTDELPMIDHIDRNKLNNNVDNLRWSSASDNQRNCKIARNNISGVTGVCYDKSRHGYVAFYYDIFGRRRNKRFREKSDAINYRKNAEELFYRSLTNIKKIEK